MTFIRAQKIIGGGDGGVRSGGASIVDVEYVLGARRHSRQGAHERLGKVMEPVFWAAFPAENDLPLVYTAHLPQIPPIALAILS